MKMIIDEGSFVDDIHDNLEFNSGSEEGLTIFLDFYGAEELAEKYVESFLV